LLSLEKSWRSARSISRGVVLKQMTKGISIADAIPEDPDDHL